VSVFTKFGGKVSHGPRKKPLDSGGNPDHVTLRLQLVTSIAIFSMDVLPSFWQFSDISSFGRGMR